MEERSGNGHAPAAALRQQAVAAIRQRNAALVSDLSADLCSRRAVRHQGTFPVILFDVDDLSGINRAHGYGVGDRMLERPGILARRFFRTHDWVARHDEDSIVVLLPGTSLDQAAQLATRFRHTGEQRLSLVDEKTDARAAITLSASAVAAGQVQTELEISDILMEAETAVARAKLDGSRRTECVALAPTSVTILSAASLLDRSVGEMRRRGRSGELKATRRGRHLHVDRADIDRLLAAARAART